MSVYYDTVQSSVCDYLLQEILLYVFLRNCTSFGEQNERGLATNQACAVKEARL